MGAHITKVIFLSHIMIVVTLMVLVAILLLAFYRFSTTVNHYHETASPYMEEVMRRAMHLVRNAEESSEAMRHMFNESDKLVALAVPKIERSVNNSVNIMERIAGITMHPTIKMSLA